ncbi:MAG: hypothetical protein IKP00_03525 [Victivallales bacterium]|nr:hypothetical protein [Victivallales bacterium]
MKLSEKLCFYLTFRRVSCSRSISKTKYRGAAYITLVTIDGTVHNAYWNDIQNEVKLDDLFQ